MFVRTLKLHDFTIFYFDGHGNYRDLLSAVNQYIDAGTTEKELFYFDKDAQIITPDQVRSIVSVASRAAKIRKPGGKTALLYGRMSLYGLGRIYKVAEGRIIEKNWDTEVFKTLAEAASWLQVPREVVEESIHKCNLTADQKPFLYQVS